MNISMILALLNVSKAYVILYIRHISTILALLNVSKSCLILYVRYFPMILALLNVLSAYITLYILYLSMILALLNVLSAYITLYILYLSMILTLLNGLAWLGLVGSYDISTFAGYLMSNPFSYKWTVLFQTIQFIISTQLNCQKYSFFKLFSSVKQFYFKQFSFV